VLTVTSAPAAPFTCQSVTVIVWPAVNVTVRAPPDTTRSAMFVGLPVKISAPVLAATVYVIVLCGRPPCVSVRLDELAVPITRLSGDVSEIPVFEMFHGVPDVAVSVTVEPVKSITRVAATTDVSVEKVTEYPADTNVPADIV
jgi:hypothetical protein